MHTTQLLDSGIVAHHNGDFSGDVRFVFQEDEQDQVISPVAMGTFQVILPMELIEYLVGVKLQNQAVSRVEDMDPLDLVRTVHTLT